MWFSVYRFRHKSLGDRELITKMRTDLRGTLEVIEGRLAQQEAKRRAEAEHEEQARLERERRRAEGEKRRATRPAMDPVMSKYAAMIESRVKEGERTGR
jgi:sRNA-binding protein